MSDRLYPQSCCWDGPLPILADGAECSTVATGLKLAPFPIREVGRAIRDCRRVVPSEQTFARTTFCDGHRSFGRLAAETGRRRKGGTWQGAFSCRAGRVSHWQTDGSPERLV